MTQIFASMLLVSVVGALLALLLLALKPLTKKCFSASWHYYIWVGVLIVMLLPVRLPRIMSEKVAEQQPVQLQQNTQMQMPAADLPEAEGNMIVPSTQHVQVQPAQSVQAVRAPDFAQRLRSFVHITLAPLAWIWAVGALLMLLWKVLRYALFLMRVKKYTAPALCPTLSAYTARKIKVVKSENVNSPLVVGVFRPTLILPTAEMTSEQLSFVLLHEVTHIHRGDILYKWFVTLVKCIHWFNPMLYVIERQINAECEVSCDLAVVENLDAAEEKNYMETILFLLSQGNKKTVPLTTGMTGNKETLKRRFTMIKKRRKIGFAVRVVSCFLAAVLVFSTVLMSGALATAFLDEHEDITFVCNGEKIDFVNAPFYENGTLYLPLRELFEKVGVFDNPENSLTWDNFKIYITLNGEIKTHYAIEIGSNGLGISHNEPFTNEMAIKMFLVTTEAPAILKGTTTYVPYDFIDYMLNRGMVHIAKDGPYDIVCVVEGETPIAYITPALQWPIDGEVVSRNFDGNTHKGIDIVSAEGTLIHSAIRGRVTEVGFDNEMGNFVRIASDSGVEAFYGHLKDVWVSEGAHVEQRTQIGSVGKTGTATGAFLHFEIKIKDAYYDPMLFWKRSSKGTLNATYSMTEAPDGVQVDIIEVDRWMNAENLSYADMLTLQNQVDEGLLPRRTIPEAVIRRFAGTIFGEEAKNGEVIALTGDGINCSATFLLNGQTYNFELYKPIKRGDNGIWVVKHFQQMDAAVIREVFLYERTPGQRSIMPNVEGDYESRQFVTAAFDYVGKAPSEVTAYFVPNGDITKRSIVGNIKAPFEYQTMAQVISVDVTLEKESEGQLWFEMTFPDGNKCASGVYNVICTEE